MNIVLVIGERPEQARALAERLGILGIESIPCAREWELALRSLTTHSVSLVLLDVNHRQPESIEFFRVLRELIEVPIIVRGTTKDPEEIVWYLDNGAADFTNRTLPPAVLAAKALSLLRTVKPARLHRGLIRVGKVSIDLDAHSVSKGAATIALTPIEFRLLRVLAENIGRACSHDELLEQVWGKDFTDCSHYLRLYVAYLRNKLEDNPHRPKMLVTEWGYGYRLMEVAAKPEPVRGRAAIRAAASG